MEEKVTQGNIENKYVEEITDSDSSGSELEDNEESINVICLFCTDVFSTVLVGLQHCVETHKFNLFILKKKFNMDCYSFIKLINYIRKNNCSSDDIMNLNDCCWSDEIYLFPVLPDDCWLTFDFEEFLESEEGENLYKPYTLPESVTDDTLDHRNIYHKLQVELSEKDQTIAYLKETICRMTQEIHKKFDILDTTDRNDSLINLENASESYFGSYDEPLMHQEMIEDYIRTSSYKHAIQQEDGMYVKDKTVLDLGCGTGILSLFAAQAGASKVYAVDNSSIIFYTMQIVRENNYKGVISPIKKLIEDDSMPFNEVDVIVSEWMGYFLLFESMLDSLIYARNRYLKPNGLLMPNRCTLYICGIGSLRLYNKHIGFWYNVYGFNMSCIGKDVIRQACVDFVNPEEVVTTHSALKCFDLHTCEASDANFTTSFSLKVTEKRPVELTSLVGYFDTFFDLKTAVNFSTSPHSHPTHWKQTIFHLPEPLLVHQDECINGTITCSKSKHNFRAVEVTITIGELNLEYIVK